MNSENRVLWAQILGLVAIVAARFGIEIPAEAQADILAGLSAFGLILTAVLAKAKKPAGAAADKQAGRAMPSLLLVLGLCSIALVSLQGCTATSLTPNHTIKATSLAVERLAEQIDLAQKTGQISNAREDALLDRLAEINKHLRLALAVTGDQQQLDLEAINRELTELRLELAKEIAP